MDSIRTKQKERQQKREERAKTGSRSRRFAYMLLAWYFRGFKYGFGWIRYLLWRYWQNLTLTTSLILYAAYYGHYRDHYFIDREKQTLHLFHWQRRADELIIQMCVNALRDQVLKEHLYAKYTADALLRLVVDDEFTKKLMTDLFIELLRGKDFTHETKKVVEWAILNYLKDDNLGKK